MSPEERTALSALLKNYRGNAAEKKLPSRHSRRISGVKSEGVNTGNHTVHDESTRKSKYISAKSCPFEHTNSEFKEDRPRKSFVNFLQLQKCFISREAIDDSRDALDPKEIKKNEEFTVQESELSPKCRSSFLSRQDGERNLKAGKLSSQQRYSNNIDSIRNNSRPLFRPSILMRQDCERDLIIERVRSKNQLEHENIKINERNQKAEKKEFRASFYTSNAREVAERRSSNVDNSTLTEFIQRVKNLSRRASFISDTTFSTVNGSESSKESKVSEKYDLDEITESLKFYYNFDEKSVNMEEIADDETLPEVLKDGNFALEDGLISFVDNPARYKNMELNQGPSRMYIFLEERKVGVHPNKCYNRAA